MPGPDRRSVGRVGSDRGALLFFRGRAGAFGCHIVNLTACGARIWTHDLAFVPTDFESTFDNFITIQKCCLIWRRGDLIGAAFENLPLSIC